MCNASESMQCVPRQREMRKNEIRDYISQQLNWAGQPMPTGDQVRERVSQLPELPAWTLAPPPPPTPAPPPHPRPALLARLHRASTELLPRM